MRFVKPAALLIAVVAAAGAPALAADVGFRGWGPRFGVSDDPDQVLGGVQFDLGEFAKHVRWQPSVEVGAGDDKISLFGNFMVSYYFPVDAAVTPYAGAQVSAWFFDNDRDPNDNNDEFDDGFNTEINLHAIGGIETRLKSGNRFLAELAVGVDGNPDFKVMVGWIFK